MNQSLPKNCSWWDENDPTPLHPHQIEFLKKITSAGIRTFVSKHGLIGGVSEKKYLDVIHRGRGKKWRLGFVENGTEVCVETVTSLAEHTDRVIEWLETEIGSAAD